MNQKTLTALLMSLCLSSLAHSSQCNGKLPWNLLADPDGGGPKVSETLVVLNNDTDVETVICYCEGEEDSYITIVNSKNRSLRLLVNSCTLVTDKEIKLNNANDHKVSGGFSTSTAPAKPKSSGEEDT